jgi:diaminohydroxyphosphoribosylaminopyrimidine deaminase / 5-amino-6-(5-phosphoribosylamino)uracil reductase
MTAEAFMRMALVLARRGRGRTSPNPMVGAVLVKKGQVIGKGWHRRAGQPHAEIEALHDAARRGHNSQGGVLHVTMEPCSTTGRTAPCTQAILEAGLRGVVAGAVDPNPRHAGRGFDLLRRGGLEVTCGVLEQECTRLNESFNHWIRQRTPWVTVKAAMTLDGKIATVEGESKWITSKPARALAMRLRLENDAILVGVRTVLSDDPALTLRDRSGQPRSMNRSPLRRVILDTHARTPLHAQVIADGGAERTTIVVGPDAPANRVKTLSQSVRVWIAPTQQGRVDLYWLLRRLGEDEVTSLLVEGGGEVHGSFLLGGHAHRVAFFYAPLILGGQRAPRVVGGVGAQTSSELVRLEEICWRRTGPDLLLTARVRGEFKRHPQSEPKAKLRGNLLRET